MIIIWFVYYLYAAQASLRRHSFALRDGKRGRTPKNRDESRAQWWAEPSDKIGRRGRFKAPPFYGFSLGIDPDAECRRRQRRPLPTYKCRGKKKRTRRMFVLLLYAAFLKRAFQPRRNSYNIMLYVNTPSRAE